MTARRVGAGVAAKFRRSEITHSDSALCFSRRRVWPSSVWLFDYVLFYTEAENPDHPKKFRRPWPCPLLIPLQFRSLVIDAGRSPIFTVETGRPLGKLPASAKNSPAFIFLAGCRLRWRRFAVAIGVGFCCTRLACPRSTFDGGVELWSVTAERRTVPVKNALFWGDFEIVIICRFLGSRRFLLRPEVRDSRAPCRSATRSRLANRLGKPRFLFGRWFFLLR